MSIKLAIIAKAPSLFDQLVEAHTTEYHAKEDVVVLKVPGIGPASLDIADPDLGMLALVAAAFDPEAPLAQVDLVTAFQKTVSVEDGYVTFRPSLAKGARAVKILVGQWADFVRFLSVANDSIGEALVAYREQAKALNAEARKAAE